MTYLSEKMTKINKYLAYIYPVILLLYPLRHIRVGAEWWDTGYNYGNFLYMDRMDEMWMFSTYLGNSVGWFMGRLPMGDTMIGMNLYTGLVISGLALAGYLFFTKWIRIPEWIAFAGEFLAMNLCWCPSALLYNYLTYALMGVGFVLLYKALTSAESRSRLYFLLAGLALGVNVYVRFSNLAQMALIVAVWAMGILRRERFGKVFSQTLWCVSGYVLGLGGVFAWIALRYGADTYIQAIVRLLSMPAEASEYTIPAMVVAQFRNYLQNIIWIGYFVAFLAVGMIIYAVFPKRIKWLARIGYLGGVVLLLYYLYGQNMFNMKYSTKLSVFQWAVMLLTATMIAGLVIVFGKRFSMEEKLLAGMGMIVLVITPLGSNNHLYSSVNNLFFVAPFTLWILWRGFCRIPRVFLLRGKSTGKELRLESYPIKALCLCMMGMICLQTILFGWTYLFSEGDGGENLHTKIENSDILKGMLTSPDRAEAISSIAGYVEEHDLKGREVILYGYIPAMSYYLEMPFAITAWPDLPSYNYSVLEQDMQALEDAVDAGKQLPVVLLEIRQGMYLLEGEEGLRKLEVSETDIEKITQDPKLQRIHVFMEKYEYSKVFQNTKFVMFQAGSERR